MEGTSSAITSSSPSSPVSPLDSAPALATTEHAPPRRRLVKASSRAHLDDPSSRISTKRESGGPPGFGFDRSSGTSASSPAPLGSNPASGASVSTSGVASNFRDRERGPIRPSVKGDALSDHSPHGSGGSSKLGRPPFAGNPGAMEARPLGRRPEVTLRRHEPPSAQKHAEDIRIQQAKRAASMRAQTMGAPGNYKNFDSQFGNFLVPVIPNQLFSKAPSTPPVAAVPPVGTQGQGR